MLLSEEFLVLLAAVTEIGDDGEAEFFNFDRVVFALEELEKIVDDPFFTYFDFVGFIEKGGICEGLEAFLTTFHIGGI